MSRPPLRLDQRKFRAAAAAMIITLLGGAAFLPFAPAPGFPIFPVCVFKIGTGLPCPLCGGTRAVQAVLRGDFSRALYLNPAALPAVVAIAAIVLVLVWEAFRGRAADWNLLLGRLRSLLPLLVALLCLYWAVHLAGALKGPKPELVDLGNPFARVIQERFSSPPR
ncbi:MAG: DUF2752 domain-containing protein [Terrimicrobiaceae bacterium]